MRRAFFFGSFLFLFAALLGGGLGACKSSSAEGAGKGQACRTTSQCADGLSCVPRPGGGTGICITNEFKIAETAKECAFIQCELPEDCCPSRSCIGRFDCDNGSCIPRCTSQADCTNGTNCLGEHCVGCRNDSQCPITYQCINTKCEPPCAADSDCPAFNRCHLGQCIEGGCQTDRECVAATHNVDARCPVDGGSCVLSCSSDLECGSPTGYNFYSCVRGQCEYVGCGDDKDCEVYFRGAEAGATFGNTHIVCRDRTRP